VRQHTIGEVRGDLGHAAAPARWAYRSPLAGEGDQALVTAIRTASPSEAVREDAAAEVSAEVALDPERYADTPGVLVTGGLEEGLEMMAHDRMER
jgi:hypothetical protein